MRTDASRWTRWWSRARGALLGPAGERVRPPLAELVADDRPLDLGRALPDAIHAELPVEAFHRVLAHVPASSVDLDGAVDDAPRRLRGVKLDRGDERVRGLRR